jgi:phosphatidylglycerophosphatase A
LKSTLDRITLLLATGLGVGWLPYSPGTFGTVWGLPIGWGLDRSGWDVATRGALLVVGFAIGVPICGRAARLLNLKDPGPVVYDELSAMPLAFVAVPFNLTTAIAGFLLFRFLDIWKPWPIRRLEHLPGGLGIMSDDVCAGLVTALILWIGTQAL